VRVGCPPTLVPNALTKIQVTTVDLSVDRFQRKLYPWATVQEMLKKQGVRGLRGTEVNLGPNHFPVVCTAVPDKGIQTSFPDESAMSFSAVTGVLETLSGKLGAAHESAKARSGVPDDRYGLFLPTFSATYTIVRWTSHIIGHKLGSTS